MISDLRDHGIVVKELHVNPKQQIVGVETDVGEKLIFTYEQLLSMASPDNRAVWKAEQLNNN